MFFPSWPLGKGTQIEGNYTEKSRHLSVLAVWDLKWSCWQFSLTVGRSGAGEFCSEPQRWAWSLRVLPYVEAHCCQQQMCWTTRLKPGTSCLGRGCAHWLLASGVHSKQKEILCWSVFVFLQFCLPVCLSVQCQIENIFHRSVSTTHTHTHANSD